MQLSTILDQIDLGTYALPEFQRGYVWTREQVRKLMTSLYKGYPIGSLLIWVTNTSSASMRGNEVAPSSTVNLILDGQQRITSLYGIIRNRPPKFFDGKASTFTDLYFNLATEVFEFYMAAKMKDSIEWINVSELMREGVGIYTVRLMQHYPSTEALEAVIDKLNRITKIKSIDLPIQQVSGEDKTIDVVVDIFNNVNSGGTKLSQGDLALAKICARYPEARIEMKGILERLRKAGYSFDLDWLLRCITVYLTGKAYYTELDDVDTNAFRTALEGTSRLIDTVLNQIGSRLGLDHNRVLGSRYSIPLMVGYLRKVGESSMDNRQWNKLLYWYIHTFLWGRYAGSTESVLTQDLNIVESGEGVDGLIRQLRQNRGDLTIRPGDFWGWSIGARFYPLMYMMTRVGHAKDWCTGLELSNLLLGKLSSLEVHHIFPKDVLYKHGYSKPEVNSIANYSFLTKACNLKISNKPPSEYFPIVTKKYPDALSSHWIPTDRETLDVSNYLEFLRQRRVLLAEHANRFLDSLLKRDTQVDVEDYANRAVSAPTSSVAEDELLIATAIWLEERGLNPGILDFELLDSQNRLLTVVDLAWPEGLQVGLGSPVALLIGEPEATYTMVSKRGFLCFTDADELKQYVLKNLLQQEDIA